MAGAGVMAPTILEVITNPCVAMPPAPLPRLSPDEQDLVAAWVCAGGPEFLGDAGPAPDAGAPDAGPDAGNWPDAGACVSPAAVTLTQLQTDVFTPICSPCHGFGFPEAGMRLEPGRTWSQTVGVPSIQATGLSRVEPGDPSRSYLMLKVLGLHLQVPGGAGERMPWGAPALPASDTARIHDWICRGAPDD